MPNRDPQKQRQYQREWYQRNRVTEIARINARRTKRLVWFDGYKRSLRCDRCKKSFKNCPEICDFHHLDPKTKWRLRGGMRQILVRHSMRLLLLEIEKCIPLCANCHRITHHSRASADKKGT